MAVLVPLSALGYALLLSLATGAASELALLAAVSGLVAALYLAALAGALHPAALVLFWGGLAGLGLGAWLARGRPGFWARFLSPGAAVFLGLTLAFALAGSQVTLQFWDEFSHWAVATKELLVTHTLPGAQGALIFKEYPLGVNLAHYWAAVNVGDREAVYYLGHLLLLAAPLAAFFGGLSWRRPWWVLGMLIAAVLVMFTLSVYVCSLMVDVALGLFLGAGLFLATRGSLSRGQVLLFAPVLMALPLIKSTGYLFAWMVVAALVIAQGKALWRAAGNTGAGRLAVALALAAVVAAPMVSHLSWGQRIRALEITPAFKTSPITAGSALQAFSGQASERHRLTRANFAKALWDTPLANYTFEPERSLVQAAQLALGLPDWVRPPQLGLVAWLVLAGLLFAAAFIRQDEAAARRRIVMVLALFLGFGAFYVFGLLLLYLFTFSEFEGPRLASFARYVNTMLMPMMLAGLALAGPQDEAGAPAPVEERAWTPGRRAAYGACLGLALLGVLAQAPNWDGAPRWRMYGDASEERSYITPLTEQLKRLTPPTARVFIVYQRSAGRGFHIARYEIAPRPANKWFFSLGAPYYEGDIWTQPLTPEEWSKMLLEERFDYVFLERADEQFWTGFGALFRAAPGQDFRDHAVFRVVQAGENLVRLEPLAERRPAGKIWWGPEDWR